MAAVEIDRVSKRFGTVTAVDSVRLTVADGEFLVLLGPSGCGKTTLLRMVAGFITPSAGDISLDGRPITNQPPGKRNIGMVFQDYALFPHMDVAANIGFGLRERRLPAAEIAQRVAALLDQVRLTAHAKSYPDQLSGGQQQRVALARALAYAPQLLLLDEPLGALDLKLREAMQQEIHALQRRLGITTIMVTHDQEEAMNLADRIVIMESGRIRQIGTPQQLYSEPASPFVAQFVGKINFLEGTIAASDAAACVVTLSGGARVAAPPHADWRPGQAVTVAVRPEAMRLVACGVPPGQNRLAATVERSIFLGNRVRSTVTLADGQDVTVESAHADMPDPGAAVDIIWHPAQTRLFPSSQPG
jgi:putative spermidine/putrescine transport system ATP-binding protein